MQNSEIKKQEGEKKLAQEKEFELNLEYLKERKLEILALFGEMSFNYLCNTESEMSKKDLDTLNCNVHILRSLILTA